MKSGSFQLLRQRWKEAAIVLHASFPQQRKGFTLFSEWVLCESLVEHVQILCERYRELEDIEELEYEEDFVYLVSDASR